MLELNARAQLEMAIKTLHANCEDIGKKGRADGTLRIVLAEVVVIVVGWRLAKDKKLIASMTKELRKKVEYQQGRRGSLETLLLRAAYAPQEIDGRKLSAWGTACRNLADHLTGKKPRLAGYMHDDAKRRMWALRIIGEYGVERLRRGEFAYKLK